jgi:hypothetical protein
MEALQVLKFQAKHELDFTVGLKEKDEVEELEEVEGAVPVEDMEDYFKEFIEENRDD